MATITESAELGRPSLAVGLLLPMSLVERQHQELVQPPMLFGEPTLPFGRTSVIHGRLPYSWADLDIYAGYGGVPVIEQERLVGVVSGKVSNQVEATASAEDKPNHRRRGIPFDQIAEASFLKTLLDDHAPNIHPEQRIKS